MIGCFPASLYVIPAKAGIHLSFCHCEERSDAAIPAPHHVGQAPAHLRKGDKFTLEITTLEWEEQKEQGIAITAQ